MFEITLNISQERQPQMHMLYTKLQRDVKSDGGVITEFNTDGRASVAIAVPKKRKTYYQAKIKDLIAFIIVDEFKFEYFSKHLHFSENSHILCRAFLKAICVHDRLADYEAVREELEFSDEINIDSFYLFRLRDLTENWAKNVKIMNVNHVMLIPSAMSEMIRYLINMVESTAMSSIVVFGDKTIKMKAASRQKTFKKDHEGYSNFLMELVRLNPLRINVTFNDGVTSDGVVDMLTEIFMDKIYFAY